MALAPLYAYRFPPEDRRAKDAIWQVLCRRFFQKYIAPDATVVDLGAGFCEFLRHTRCGERIAVDLDEGIMEFAPPGTRLIRAPAHELQEHLSDASVDVVFASNFFEHLPDKATFLATLGQVQRILRPGGKLLVLQPNIRVIGGRYWDFVDHHIPLTDRSLVEAVRLVGLEVTEVVPRFLPYTTRSRTPQHPALVRLYLLARPLWFLMGGQTWLVARKPGPDRAR
jgi:SAM-dependent methyltransferase